MEKDMKVIFLDFDGVINDYFTFNMVNTQNVAVLKRIMYETDAKIVVTSSNKYAFQNANSLSQMEQTAYYRYMQQLEERGVHIFDLTPDIDGDREHEILEYLKDHPEIEQFLILDDDYIIEALKDHQIFLDLQSGLREKHIIPSIRILNGELNFYHDSDNLKETEEDRVEKMNKEMMESSNRNDYDDQER